MRSLIHLAEVLA